MDGLPRLKIAFVHQPWSVVDPPVRINDSVALVTDEVARCLVDRCEVICYSRRGKHQPERQTFGGVHYHHVSAPIDRWARKLFEIPASGGWGNPKRPFYASEWFYRQFIGHVAEHLHRENPDIVHLHNFSQFVPFLRRTHPDVKIVLHMHAEWLNQLDPALMRPRVAAADLIIGVSDYITNQICKAFPQYADKCRTVYNGVDVDKFYPSGGRKKDACGHRVISVGRVSPEKGIHLLIDAFKRVRERFPDARLDIVGGEHVQPRAFYLPICGDNPAVTSLEAFYRGKSYMAQMVARSGGEKQGVVFHGNVDHSQIGQHLNDADIFVQPSVWNDPSPLTLYEALSAGVPVVATRVGGQPEIVKDGRTGLIVDNDDPAAMAAAIAHLFEDDAVRIAMREAARTWAKTFFTWRRVADDLMALYEQLCGSKRRGGVRLNLQKRRRAGGAAESRNKATIARETFDSV